MIVDVGDPSDARVAEDDGAEAIVIRGEIAGIREATELPILWCGSGGLDAAQRAGADAALVIAAQHDEDGTTLQDVASYAADIGLDVVVSVASDEELARVLEQHDPETFLLAADDLEHALELLSDVPVGKLAIAQAQHVTRDEVVELERRGVDAVIVPARNVAELVGGAPPVV